MAKKNILVGPVLKWVGGKRQLLEDIVQLLPKDIHKLKYVEPFIGGGALFFHLQNKNALINDFNEELINVYNVIKLDVNALIEDLKKHENTSDYYYRIRALDRDTNYKNLTSLQKASRFIYLNKTCYNGLYRVNNSGEFNSPFGQYKNPNIVNEFRLRAVNNYLRENQIDITSGDYELIIDKIDPKSFVYLDPPYYPISATSNFTGYIQGGWDMFDQIRLKKFCDILSNKNIKFLLSNSASGFIEELYKDYNIHQVKALRLVNSNALERGEVNELIISNY